MNLEDVVLFQLDQVVRQSKIYSQREFDAQGVDITVDQWVLMKIVHEHQGISQRTLAQKALRDPASITRSIDLLSKKELLQRQSIPENRRRYAIHLTRNGEKFVERLMPMVTRHRANSIQGISDEELEQLRKTLSKMISNMG